MKESRSRAVQGALRKACAIYTIKSLSKKACALLVTRLWPDFVTNNSTQIIGPLKYYKQNHLLINISFIRSNNQALKNLQTKWFAYQYITPLMHQNISTSFWIELLLEQIKQQCSTLSMNKKKSPFQLIVLESTTMWHYLRAKRKAVIRNKTNSTINCSISTTMCLFYSYWDLIKATNKGRI